MTATMVMTTATMFTTLMLIPFLNIAILLYCKHSNWLPCSKIYFRSCSFQMMVDLLSDRLLLLIAEGILFSTKSFTRSPMVVVV